MEQSARWGILCSYVVWVYNVKKHGNSNALRSVIDCLAAAISLDGMNCEWRVAYFGDGYRWCGGAPERYSVAIFRYAGTNWWWKSILRSAGFTVIVREEGVGENAICGRMKCIYTKLKNLAGLSFPCSNNKAVKICVLRKRRKTNGTQHEDQLQKEPVPGGIIVCVGFALASVRWRRWLWLFVPCGSAKELSVKEIAKAAVMHAHEAARAVRPMPIRAAPYRCQIAALNFARGLRSILFCGGEGER